MAKEVLDNLATFGTQRTKLNSNFTELYDLKAPLASPALTGTPTAPTAAAATNTTQVATTAFVRTEVANLVASAPGALDTLDELAAALGDDANYAATVTSALAGKQATLVSATNIKTVNGTSLLGSGNITISGGAWGGITGTLSDQTDLQNALNAKLSLAGGTLTGALVSSYNGAASAPGLRLSGTWFQGTAVTSKPQILIEPTGATSDNWDGNGTAFGINAAAGFTGNLFDIQLNGISRALLSFDGTLTTRKGVGFYDGELCAGRLYQIDADYAGLTFLATDPAIASRMFWGNNNNTATVLNTAGTMFLRRQNGSVVIIDTDGFNVVDKFRISVPSAIPATATTAGLAGTITWDGTHIYLAIADSVWRRVAHSNW